MLLPHSFHDFQQSDIQSVRYCKDCGALQYKDKTSIKPNDFNHKREIDPTKLFDQLKNNVFIILMLPGVPYEQRKFN